MKPRRVSSNVTSSCDACFSSDGELKHQSKSSHQYIRHWKANFSSRCACAAYFIAHISFHILYLIFGVCVFWIRKTVHVRITLVVTACYICSKEEKKHECVSNHQILKEFYVTCTQCMVSVGGGVAVCMIFRFQFCTVFTIFRVLALHKSRYILLSFRSTLYVYSYKQWSRSMHTRTPHTLLEEIGSEHSLYG